MLSLAWKDWKRKASHFPPDVAFQLYSFHWNRPAPNLQLGLGTNYDVGSCIQQYFLSSPGTNSAKKSNKRFISTYLLQCSALFFWQLRLMANCRYNFPRHISFPSLNFKLGADLFISNTLRGDLIVLNKFK